MQKLKQKKSGQRFLCLAMAAVLLAGTTTGCGKKAKKDNVTVAETVAESTENIMERPTENVTKPAEEKPTENVTEPSGEKPTENVTKPSGEKPTENVTEPSGEKPTENVTKPSGEKPTENVTEPSGEKPTENVTETSEEKPTEQETVTEEETETDRYVITIGNAAGDAVVKQLTGKKGVKLSSINGPYIDGKIFLGWYYDSALNDKVAVDDILDKNMTLYADYGDAMPINEGGSPNYISAVEQDRDFTIYVTTDTAKRAVTDADEVKAALKLTNITSPERTDDSNTLEKDELVVAKTAAGRYSVKVNGGFRAGDTYRLEIIDNDIALTFEGQTEDVVYYNFTIKKDEILNLSLNTGIKYLAASELEKQYADNIMAYTGLYTAEKDAQTGETVYKPTNATGAFTYKAGEYIAGDVIAVYTGTKPDERTLDTSLDEAVSYIEITMVESDGDTAVYSYKSANATDVLFTPDIIPIDIDNGDGVTGWTEAATQAAIGYFEIENSKLNFTDSKYAAMGLDFSTTVEAGDFIAFFSGDFGAEDAQQKGYGKITEVIEEKTKTKISYELVSYDDVLSAMDIYNESQLTEAQLNSIDEQLIVSTIENQVIESGFAQEAGMYLAALAVETDEVKDLLGESELTIKDCTVTYADGTPVSDGEIMLTAEDTAGANQPTVTVNVSRDLVHFEEGSGFRVEVALKYAFDVQKTGSKNKVAIEMTAVFETEVLLGFSASGGAVWKMKWIFPYIYDYKMSGSIDQGLYTGIAITATARLDEDEPENTFGPELLEPDGLEDYAQQLIDLSESIKNMMEENKHAGEEGEEGDNDDGESAGTASGGLLEKYERFISAANDKWIDLIEAPIFAAEGSLDPFYVTAYSIDVKFVVSANMSVAIGMSFQYEKSQRHTFTMMLFHRNQSSSETVDLSTEYFQFDFYVMGTLGIRAGVRAKVLFGLFSTKLAGIGLQLEAGAYARLWGYFYYCMSWEKGKDIESSATGAVLMEIGAYLDVNLAMEVMNGTFSFNPSIYSNEWPIWHVGERENVLDFVYDEEGKWTEENDDGAEIEYSIPLSFDMVRTRTMEVPSEIFRMRYMDLKEGGEGCLTYDGNKRASFNAAASEYDDEERFFVEMSDPHFKYNPVDNTITVVPEEGVGSYEGTMTITWKQPDLTYASKTISQTFNITWVDPDAGYCLAFDTKGGTVIRTKVYGIGKEVEAVENPTKIGYAFDGWYSDKNCTRAEAVPTTMPAHDVTLYAKWKPIPNVYTVRHYYESLSTQYELTETTKQYNVYDVDETSGKKTRRDYIYTDDVLKAEELVRDNQIVPEGFEIDWSLTTSSMSVAPDGSTVVDIYYKRQIHSVTYSMGELKDSDNPDVVIRYRYGETIYVPTYFMPGYTFENWEKKYGNPAESDVSENNKNIIMGVEDMKYVAKWTADDDTPYYIEYYILDKSSGMYIMLGGDNGKIYKEGTTGATVSVKDNLLKDVGCTLNYATVNGRGADTASTGKIDAYGKLTIAYYYEGEDYYITYDLDGGEFLGDDANKYPYMYTHGFALELKDVTPVKEGYSFVGWLEGDEPVTSIPSYRAGDINLTAEWRADKGDLALYDSDGTTLGNVRATYGETVPSLKSIPVKAGYDFAGFYTEEGEEYYDAAGNGKVIWLGAKDIRLKASWTAKRLTISFDVNGGDTELASIEGTYLDNYPALPAPARQGYSFVGWTVENDASGNYVTSDTVINNPDAHTLVAQWENGTNTRYTVERYVEKAADGNNDGTDTEKSETAAKEYVLYDKSIGYGTTNEDVVINASLYGIAGYAFDGNNSQNVLTGTVKADGSTVFALYYNIKPADYFTVTYDYGRDDMPYKTQYVKDGETYGLPDVGTTTDDHMKLVGWRDDTGVFNKDNYATVNHSDAHYTAVWEKDEYTVFYRLSNADFATQTYSYNDTDKLMGELFLLDPVKDENGNIIKYYKFAGWNTKQDGSGKMYMPGTSLSDVELVADESDYGRKSLYGQWELVDVPEGMTPYIVAHKVEFRGGNGYSTYYTLKFGEYGTTTDAVTYEFSGDVEAQEINQKKIGVDVVTEPASDNDSFNHAYSAYKGYTVVEVVYNRIPHTFTVKLDNGGDDITWTQLSGIGLMGNIPSAPSKAGYEFAGWDYKIPEYMPEHDVTLTAKYRETDRRAVTVKYYMQNLDGTYNETPEATEVIYGKTGTAITPAPEVFAGFKTPEIKSVTVLDDGSAVCEYRYERAEYTITWDAGEGELTGTDYSAGKVKYGQTITAPGLNRPGYTGAWKNLTDTMPANDVTFTADYEAQDVFYSVVYRRMNVDGAYTLMYSQNRTAKAGSIVQESCEVSDEYASQVAEGYIKPLVQTVEIAGDGSTVIYYDYRLIKSHLGYDLSGGTAVTSNYAQSGDYYYGKTLQIPVLSQVKRTGYAAKGWYDASDPSKKLVDGNNITIGAKDVTYKLLWEPVTYTITYDLVLDGAQSLNNPSQYRTGLDFNISAPKCDDMSFVRWEWAGDGAMPAEIKILANGLVHVTGGAHGNLKFRAVWSEDKLVFSATLYDGSPETYIYYYPAAGSEDITLAQIAVPVREGYVFSYWTKKIPKSTYGYYDVVLRDDTKVSTLNFNIDFVTANWMPLVTTDGYDGYQICVSSEKELELAIEYIKSDSRYTGIALSNDITINELSEPLFEIFDDGYVLLGNNHKLMLKRAAAPLFGENHGEIRELGIVGNVNNSVDTAKAEETGFGVIAGVNKGIIKGCFIEGVSTDDGVTRNTITSNAAYFGGFVGINEGTITECRISDTNVIWDDTAAVSDSNYIGGFAGKNDNNGTITNSSMTSATVSVKSGYDINTSHRLYIGGYAGMNQGMISDSTVAGSRIGNEYLVSSANVAYMSAGGFAGIDAVSGIDADVRGISGVTISDTEIRSESVAGGIIGENNYALIEKASLTNVYVYGGREYAGQLAGINRSTAAAEGYCYYTNARTQTKTGKAGVIAGLCEKPEDYDGMTFIIAVRTNDNKTTVINGDEFTNYGKGAFFYEFRKGKVWIQFYDIKNLAEKW